MASSRVHRSRSTAGVAEQIRNATKQSADEADQLTGGSIGDADPYQRRFEAPGGASDDVRDVVGHDERILQAPGAAADAAMSQARDPAVGR